MIEKREINKVSPIIAHLLAWRVSEHSAGEGTKTESGSLSELRKQSGELGEAKVTRIFRAERLRGDILHKVQYTGLHTMRDCAPESCRAFFLNLPLRLH